MIGRTFLMEFRRGWKGLTLFLIVVMITAGGMVQFYPAVEEAMGGQPEGAENVKMDIEGSTVELSWEQYPNVTEYKVLQDNRSHMLTSTLVYNGTENYTEVQLETNETKYFAVLGILNGTDEVKFIGMATTVKTSTAFDELMESDFYRGLRGDREFSMTDIKGFISIEFFSWWFLLSGLYIGYISVNSITKDFEEKRMDLIFSTPLSRTRYILEKFAAIAFYSFIMVLLTGLIMVGSAQTLDVSVDAVNMISAIMGSWPVLLVVEAVAMLCAIFFVESRRAVGMTLLFAFTQYALQIISNFAKKYEYIGEMGILGHWDYNQVLFDEVFGYADFLLLTVITAIILTAAIFVFKKRDIPI